MGTEFEKVTSWGSSVDGMARPIGTISFIRATFAGWHLFVFVLGKIFSFPVSGIAPCDKIVWQGGCAGIKWENDRSIGGVRRVGMPQVWEPGIPNSLMF